MGIFDWLWKKKAKQAAKKEEIKPRIYTSLGRTNADIDLGRRKAIQDNEELVKESKRRRKRNDEYITNRFYPSCNTDVPITHSIGVDAASDNSSSFGGYNGGSFGGAGASGSWDTGSSSHHSCSSSSSHSHSCSSSSSSDSSSSSSSSCSSSSCGGGGD